MPIDDRTLRRLLGGVAYWILPAGSAGPGDGGSLHAGWRSRHAPEAVRRNWNPLQGRRDTLADSG